MRAGFLIPTFALSSSPSPTTVYPLPNRTQTSLTKAWREGTCRLPGLDHPPPQPQLGTWSQDVIPGPPLFPDPPPQDHCTTLRAYNVRPPAPNLIYIWTTWRGRGGPLSQESPSKCNPWVCHSQPCPLLPVKAAFLFWTPPNCQ